MMRPNRALQRARKKGRHGDTMLAHINPLEAMMLKEAGGSGTINPETGLPEYSMFKPKKLFKSAIRTALPVGGAILGNTIAPGIGGMVGGSIGGAVGNKATGKKASKGALKGLAIGGLLPSAASGLGSLTGNNALSQYGDTNAILPSLGLGGSDGSSSGFNPLSLLFQGGGSDDSSGGGSGDSSGGGSGGKKKPNLSYMAMLGSKSKDYFSSPSNVLSLLVAGSQIKGRPKPKKEPTASERGRMRKEEMLAARLTPEELAEQEKYNLAMEQANRRLEMDKFLPEERIHINPLYTKVSSPEEYENSRQWLTYYDNPEFRNKPINF